MKEFGSDFHFLTEYQSQRAHLTDVHRDAVLMADGRQCIVALIRQEGWRRIWMPEYFCYEVIDAIKAQTRIETLFYPDHLLQKDGAVVRDIPFQDGDVLLRMNYFGMRGHRSNTGIHVPVIEDHTHDLLGHWALYSDADWCIASLRKTVPIPEGGMVWSPKGHGLPQNLTNTEENKVIAAKRWQAMEMKSDYLAGRSSEKEAFRKLYVETEEWLGKAEPSLIDERSKEYIQRLDINAWQGAKRRNWQLLHSLLNTERNGLRVVLPEDGSCTMLSLVALTESREQRDALRHRLIEQAVYPAILWQVPEKASDGDCKSPTAIDFSHRMLSIHCDGRYTEDEIRQLAAIVNQAVEG